MVVHGGGTVVPAVRLTWRLQVPAGAAAVLVVAPFLLVDGEAVARGGVGQILHPSPHEDGRANATAQVELNEGDVAVWQSGLVGRVVHHFTGATYNSALVWFIHANFQPFTEGVVVLCNGAP